MSVKVFFSAFFIAQFTSSCSNECRIRIAPNETIASLNGSSVTVQCTAYNCGYVDIKINKENAHCTPFEETSEGSVVTNCSSIVGMADNGSFIHCFNQVDGSQSAEIELLVQGTIERVTRFDISKSDIDSCNISWGPVFAYEQLTVYYNIALNEMFNTTTNTWTVFDTSGLDSCQFARLNITSFISTNNQTLGNTSHWRTPIETPPTINDLKYVMTMNKNGSVLLNITLYFNLTDCVCPGRTNEVFCTVKNENISYSDTAKVVSDTNCTGYATFMLPPYIRIDAEIILSNHFGTTNSGERLFFDLDTNPLRNITYKRNSSSPIVQFTCIFSDDVMVTNQYSTGCLYYYKMAMGEVKRENNEASFTLNTSGNFSICGLSIPSPDRCINSSETDSTTPSSSTTHENCFFWMYCIVGFLVGVVIGGLIGGLIGIVIGVILQQILQLLVLKITSVAHSLAPPTLSTLNEISIQPSNKQTSSFQRAESETISFQASDSGLYRSISESCYNTAPSKSHKNEDDHAALSDPYSTESVSAASSDERQPNIVTGRGNRNMSNKSNENFASTPSD